MTGFSTFLLAASAPMALLGVAGAVVGDIMVMVIGVMSALLLVVAGMIAR